MRLGQEVSGDARPRVLRVPETRSRPPCGCAGVATATREVAGREGSSLSISLLCLVKQEHCGM